MSKAPSATPAAHDAPAVRWRSAELSVAERAQAESWLSPPERARLGDMRDVSSIPADRADSFLAGRMLLRELAGELLGRDASAVVIEAVCIDCGGPHGQPRVADSPLQLSLSRTGGLVIAAASMTGAVGIDIAVRDDSADVAAALGSVTGHPSVQHWTRVEAVLKADGRGLRIDPREVRVEQRGTDLIGTVDGSVISYRIEDVDVASDLRASLAIEL